MVSEPLAQLRFDLPDGLIAIPRTRRTADGATAVRRDRRGRSKLDEVDVVASAPPSTDLELEEAEERFILGAGRRSWPVIEARYGTNGLTRARELARAGVVTLRCQVDDNLRLTLPLSWQLTDAWLARRDKAITRRDEDRRHWLERKFEAAAAVAATCPELAASLEAARPHSPTLPVLVYAAEDLAAGVVHDGPRAFSQRHFGHTKERDDVAHVLREAGVPAEALARLGVRRSGRIGVAGPISVTAGGTSYCAAAFDGPQLLRTDQRDLTLSLETRDVLVVIENLQAAETIADRYPDLPVIYGAGYTGPKALALIESVAAEAERVLLIPDADADGVAIAARWLSVAPEATIVDIGEVEHTPTAPLPGWARRKLEDQLDGSAADFARAILKRGYPLEEEMLVVRALARAINRRATAPTHSDG